MNPKPQHAPADADDVHDPEARAKFLRKLATTPREPPRIVLVGEDRGSPQAIAVFGGPPDAHG